MASLLVTTILGVSLQYSLWFGKDGVAKLNQLQQQVIEQKNRNEVQEFRNQYMKKEVLKIKNNSTQMERLARYNLNMIKEGEVFFQMSPTTKFISDR